MGSNNCPKNGFQLTLTTGRSQSNMNTCGASISAFHARGVCKDIRARGSADSALAILLSVVKLRLRRVNRAGDKGRFGSYLKLCDFTSLFMTLQAELRLNKKDH